MRRVDRLRLERRQRLLRVFGLAFSLGALTSGALLWRADRLASSAAPVVESVLTERANRPTGGNPAAAVLSPAPTSTSGSEAMEGRISDGDATRLLKMRHLAMPVDGILRDQLSDNFEERRAAGLRRHEAIDIMAPRGTPVRAVEDAQVAKLFRSVAGGLTIYLTDPARMFIYYYAHLDRYALGLQENHQIRRGELIGFVGSTGNASEDAPHLHFAIFQVGPGDRWWQGDPINPFPVLR
jgi:murein DD-endopeptidase MepM/ murein hydrolase activator NlpD